MILLVNGEPLRVERVKETSLHFTAIIIIIIKIIIIIIIAKVIIIISTHPACHDMH